MCITFIGPGLVRGSIEVRLFGKPEYLLVGAREFCISNENHGIAGVRQSNYVKRTGLMTAGITKLAGQGTALVVVCLGADYRLLRIFRYPLFVVPFFSD